MQLKIILEVEQDSICARCHYSTYIELFSLYPSDGNYSTVLLEEARVSSLTLVINCFYFFILFLSWGLTPSIYLS